jgi:hypothetical protein
LSAGTLTIFLFDLGDIGPGGGRIFYRSGTGFIMTDTNEVCHYLEAASVGNSKVYWSSDAFNPWSIYGTHGPQPDGWYYFDGTADGIGTGRKNTGIILSIDANAPPAKACKNYSNNGKNDWFLPSINELQQLYINSSSIGNLETGGYWSSTLYELGNRPSNGAVRVQIFDDRNIMEVTIANAANLGLFRAIRAF